MPIGDLLTAPGQWEIRGLLLGRGTPYPIDNVQGFGIDTRSTDEDNPSEHGGYSVGPDLQQPRQFILTIGVNGDDGADLNALVDALMAAWRPVRAGTIDVALWTRGHPKRIVRARPRRIARPEDMWSVHGQTSAVAELRCPDPRIYAAAEENTAIVIAAGATAAAGAIAAEGTADTLPIVEITGPARTPAVAFTPTGGATRSLKFDVDLAAGQTLIADVATKEIRINGALQRAARAPDLQWPVIEPGNNAIAYTRSGTGLTGAASTATVRYRDAWSG